MTSQLSIPAGVLYFEGAVNTIFGVYGILRPAAWQAQMSDSFSTSFTGPLGYTLSLQLLNMGALSILAAGQKSLHRPALIARIAVHLLAGYLLWDGNNDKLKGMAMTDTGFAVMNAIAIAFVR